MERSFNIIAAMDSRNGIGSGGSLPWHLTGDLRHFKNLTTRTSSKLRVNALIMGRRTWESLPREFQPLPGRVNIVLSRTADFELPGGVYRAADLVSALRLPQTMGLPAAVDIEEVFVIGGADVFAQAVELPLCQKLFITHVIGDFGCDTFFPDVKKYFIEAERSKIFEESPLRYYFAEYTRRD